MTIEKSTGEWKVGKIGYLHLFLARDSVKINELGSDVTCLIKISRNQLISVCETVERSGMDSSTLFVLEARDRCLWIKC